jgi:murein DD-endopeptidase MepM/ murein hydrolase activator NlpD
MKFKNLLDPKYQEADYFPIDLSIHNPYWNTNDVSDIATMDQFLANQREKTGKVIAHGGYREQRALYRKSARFQDGRVRDVHMGIDLWAPAGTSIHATMDGKIHSYADNDDAGNYGPTLVLEHDWNGKKLYSLYGHLSKSDMQDWGIGLPFRVSQKIATLGTPEENGGYSPHLHFQVMTTVEDYHGDFPGVLAQEDLIKYAGVILDPNPFIFG